MELFHYLSVAIAHTVFCEGNVVISTVDENVLGSPVPGADSYRRIPIIANDTDIIVLGISFFSDTGVDKL